MKEKIRFENVCTVTSKSSTETKSESVFPEVPSSNSRKRGKVSSVIFGWENHSDTISAHKMTIGTSTTL